jgi:hypothetical protein
LNLRIYAISTHFHPSGIKDVPLSGIHSIPHPEEKLIVIPIYEINYGFYEAIL